MKSEKWATLVVTMLLCASTICAIGIAGPTFAAPADHAPIGVMGDHTHHAGEVMFSYRYMRMGMNGLRDDAGRISRRRVLDDFPVAPTSMDMEMHMFGAMYAPIDRLTLVVMVPYVLLEMDHRVRTGVKFSTRTEGIGDVRAAALVDLWKSGNHKIHANFGISFPTGSIAETDRTPASGGAKVRLPYPMQLGSGSFDFLPGLTYNGKSGALSWGAQARGEIRLNENHADYTQGNEYALTGWGAFAVSQSVSLSLRTEWQHSLNIRGRDASLNVAMVPTADPGRRTFMRLDALAGVNFEVPTGALAGIRFAVEAGLPVYQRLDGPGLETDYLVTAGVQYAFH